MNLKSPQNLQKQLHRSQLGKKGEDYAANYLVQHGYIILERNFKARFGELDIISRKNNVLVFVEVKTRIGEEFGKPEEAVTRWKLREVIKTSQYYLLKHPTIPQEWQRIDVIGIEYDENDNIVYFNHIQNVTG